MRDRQLEQALGIKRSWGLVMVETTLEQRASRLGFIHCVMGLALLYYWVESLLLGYSNAQVLHSCAFGLLLANEYIRVRHKWVTLASWTLLLFTILLLFCIGLLDGQADSSGRWLYAVVPLIAGQLLGVRAMLYSVVAVSLAATAVELSEYWIPLPREYPGTWLDVLVLRFISLLLCSVLSLSFRGLFERQVSSLERQSKAIRDKLIERDEDRRAKSVFLSSMSGQVRQPVRELVEVSHFLAHHPSLQGKELAKITERCSLQVKRLVNDILDLSDVENQRLFLSSKKVDVSEFAAKVEDWFDNAETGAMQLQIELPRDPRTVTLDENRLVQIVQRLMDNARTFSGGQELLLRIAFRKEDGGNEMMVLTVQDDGCGIDPGLQAQMLKDFAFLHHSGASQDRGAGLSFALINHLVTLMGGELSLHSRVGHGTRVELRFPANSTAQAHQRLAA